MPSPKRIGQIEFGLLSPKEIRKMSVRKIISDAIRPYGIGRVGDREALHDPHNSRNVGFREAFGELSGHL